MLVTHNAIPCTVMLMLFFQILWFSKELVKNNMNGADSVCHSLIRQIAGGDVSPKNIWLAEAVLDIFVENR